MRDRIADLGDAEVALVLFTAPRNLRGYKGRSALPFAVVTSEDRAAYRAYGFRRGSVLRVWGPKAISAYVGLLRKGRKVERPTEDTLQLGGDVVVDREGRVAYLYRGSGPDDRPPIDELVSAVRST